MIPDFESWNSANSITYRKVQTFAYNEWIYIMILYCK